MHHQRIVDYDCFFCNECRIYVYDESKGDFARGVAPKTIVDALPMSWQCPVCGANRDSLRACTLIDGYTYSEDFVEKQAVPLQLGK